jgi:hypothetical protein
MLMLRASYSELNAVAIRINLIRINNQTELSDTIRILLKYTTDEIAHERDSLARFSTSDFFVKQYPWAHLFMG